MDRAAGHLAGSTGPDIRNVAVKVFCTAGLTVGFTDIDALRMLDRANGVVHISSRAPPETRTFQLLLQVGLEQQNILSEVTLDLARLHSDAARDIAKIGLANYFAGPPYCIIVRLRFARAGMSS